MFLEVALPLPLSRTFYYRCNEKMFRTIQPAQRVLVPFQNRTLTAFALKTHDNLPSEDLRTINIKAVLQVVDPVPLISPGLLTLSQWVAGYYFASLGEVLKACLPLGSDFKTQKMAVITRQGEQLLQSDIRDDLKEEELRILKILSQEKSLTPVELRKATGLTSTDSLLTSLVSRKWVTLERRVNSKVRCERTQLHVSMVSTPPDKTDSIKLTSLQSKVLNFIQKSREPLVFSELLTQLKVSRSILHALEKKGVIRISEEPSHRNPLRDMKADSPPFTPEHTCGQRAAIGILSRALEDSSFSACLLHGVTGSGKTEIYLTLIEKTLAMGKSCLVLMPEIGLTPRVAEEFHGRLRDVIAILHSGLSDGERSDEWWRIQKGTAKVVIGTRSAVFAPLENIGLIVVDEEHDASFKQQESPRYHGRDTALVRGKHNNALVVLGSATPSIETFFNAKNGKYGYIRLASRVQNRPLPEIALVDMREEFKSQGKKSALSSVLKKEIQCRLTRKEQVLVLLNRRGYSASVLCRHCGQSVRCRNCSIALTYHKSKEKLLCHYCSYEQPVPARCPACAREHLYFLGEGTEKIEFLLEKCFPEARVARLDRDTARKKGSQLKIIRGIQTGEIDILTGTQMISKGHDFPQVTLVGILSADSTLSLPDFRSAERTFQLFTQMSGRAGRGELPGTVLIQTYFPEHYCLQYVRRHDYEGFYEKELRFRKLMHYPPFTAMATILSRDRSLDRAIRIINSFAGILSRLSSSDTRIFGPALSPLARLKSEHRYQVLVKAKTRAGLRNLLQDCLAQGEKEGLDFSRLHIDIDPINVM